MSDVTKGSVNQSKKNNMNNEIESDKKVILKALDVLCPISIMSYISFCETLLDENRTPFPYISFRVLDVMLKAVAFSDITELAKINLNALNMVSMYERARTALEDEEAGFFDQYPDPDQSEINEIVRNAIIHQTNHQFAQIPDHSLPCNWLRLNYLLNITELKNKTEIQDRFPDSIDVKTTLNNLLGSNILSVCLVIMVLTDNLLYIYKDGQFYSMLKTCNTQAQYCAATIQIIDSILQQRLSSATLLRDMSQLLAFLESHHELEKLMNLLTQSLYDFRHNYSKHHQMAQSVIPELQTSSYRYESPLLKRPLVQVANERIIPNFYDLFTCLREFPIRFNEYLDSEQNANIRNTMGIIYELYVGELLEFTLEPDRFIIIPEFAYQRSGSEVKGPDYVVIDRIDLHVFVIEVKGTRTSNVIRDDPASLQAQEYVERVYDVLNKTITKIDELFSCVGGYSKYGDIISKCKMDKTTIIFVQKDFGVLMPSLIHGEIAKLDPDLSEKCNSFNYCLIDIPYLETILHNYKVTRKPLTGYLKDYHNAQIGKTEKPVSVAEWIPYEHGFNDLIYVNYLRNQVLEEV